MTDFLGTSKIFKTMKIKMEKYIVANLKYSE